MKILACIDFETRAGAMVTEPLALTDASLLTGGKPQFLPDLSHRYALLPSAAIVLQNTGRKIAPRFVHRYCAALAPATLLVDLTELERARTKGIPFTRALSFDFNVARGATIPFSPEAMDEWVMETSAVGQVFGWSTCADASDWRQRLADLSRIYTFRTGDLVLPAPKGWMKVEKDCHISIDANTTNNQHTRYEYNIK